MNEYNNSSAQMQAQNNLYCQQSYLNNSEAILRYELEKVKDSRRLRALELAVDMANHRGSANVIGEAQMFYDFLIGK